MKKKQKDDDDPDDANIGKSPSITNNPDSPETINNPVNLTKIKLGEEEIEIPSEVFKKIKSIGAAEILAKQKKDQKSDQFTLTPEELEGYQKYLEEKHSSTGKKDNPEPKQKDKKDDPKDLEQIALQKVKEELEKKVISLEDVINNLNTQMTQGNIKNEIQNSCVKLRAINPEHIFLLIKDRISLIDNEYTVLGTDGNPEIDINTHKPISIESFLNSFKEQNKSYFHPDTLPGTGITNSKSQKSLPSSPIDLIKTGLREDPFFNN